MATTNHSYRSYVHQLSDRKRRPPIVERAKARHTLFGRVFDQILWFQIQNSMQEVGVRERKTQKLNRKHWICQLIFEEHHAQRFQKPLTSPSLNM